MITTGRLPLLNLRFILVLTTIATLMLVSGALLSLVGIEYVTTGGNPLAKIHPANYIAAASILLLAVLGEYRSYLRILREDPGLIVYFGGVVGLEIYLAAFASQPATPVIDTFLLAGLMFLLIRSLSARENAVMGRFIDAYMLANSTVAIGELLFQRRLIPASLGSVTQGILFFPYEWRPSGFIGHPLAASLLTACYLLILILRRRNTSQTVHFVLLAVNGVGLLAYASRSALGTFLVIVCLMLALLAIRTLRGARVDKNLVETFAFLLPVGIVGVGLLWLGGFLDRFMGRIEFDKGSASARTLTIDFLSDLSWTQIVRGIPVLEVSSMIARYDLFAIENFWIGFIVFNGIIGVFILFPGLFLFSKLLINHTDQRKGKWVVFFFYVIQTGQVGMSAKTLVLAQLTTLLLVGLRPSEAPARTLRRASEPALRARRTRPGLLSPAGAVPGR